MESLANSLKIFASEFGDIQSHKPAQQMPQTTFVSAGNGDFPYRKQYPYSVQVIEEVSFKDAGPGFVVFVFNKVKGQLAESRHFCAKEVKIAPIRLAAPSCRVIKVEGSRVYLAGLDAVHGTPVLDIKPWVKEFGPRGEVYQPSWMGELMKTYWQEQYCLA